MIPLLVNHTPHVAANERLSATEADRLQDSANAMYTASLQERMMEIFTMANGAAVVLRWWCGVETSWGRACACTCAPFHLLDHRTPTPSPPRPAMPPRTAGDLDHIPPSGTFDFEVSCQQADQREAFRTRMAAPPVAV